MEKIRKLQKEIIELEKQKEEAKKLIDEIDAKVWQAHDGISEEYGNFFINKNNKNFVYYDKYPNIESLSEYTRRNNDFPLYSDGIFDSCELAEIIKYLYQFKRQKEYQILTIGASEREMETIYGGKIFSVKPHLYFLIGNEETLKPFIEYDGSYNSNDKVYTNIFLKGNGRDLVSLELKRIWDFYNRDRLDIECYTDTRHDLPLAMNYYDFEEKCYKSFMVSKYMNVFSSYVRSNLNSSKRPGIKDVLDFKLDFNDTFIAKVLISIVIYKKNNNLKQLRVEDYNHIFKVLFNEEVDIIRESEQDIHKQLRYVPEQRKSNIFIMNPRK